MSKTILAVIEFERFPLEVAKRAARLAELYDCELEVVLSDPTIGFLRRSFMISVDSQQISDTVQQAQKEELQRIVTALAEFDVKISTSIIQDRPASDAIVAKALELEPLFVVKGTEYHSPAERAVFTFNDWQLIRKLDFPVWLVKVHEWKEEPVVVAAVDPIHPGDEDGRLAQAIVDMAGSVAGKLNGQLLLMTTYELLEEVNAWAKLEFKPLTVPMEELQQKMHDEHARELDSLAASKGIDPQAIHLLPGRTKDILPAFAREKDADLVIMGAVARSGLKRRLIGSTAEHVLDHLPCDILIVHGG
jgi:universal stress protein E